MEDPSIFRVHLTPGFDAMVGYDQQWVQLHPLVPSCWLALHEPHSKGFASLSRLSFVVGPLGIWGSPDPPRKISESVVSCG